MGVNEGDLVMTFPEGSIEELEARVKAMKAARQADKERLKSETPLIWRYSIVKSRPNGSMFDRIMDDSCILYRIEGEVVNKAEAEAAGHNLDRLGGGMNYLFNTLSKKFVMPIGGGHYYISDRFEKKNTEAVTWERIAEFVTKNPDGGDITDIVKAHRGES
jgi:hypothetical protein